MISKATIRRWNKKFNDATKAGKRVLIAKDVIEQINAGKYKPTSVYTNITSKVNYESDFQSNFDKVKCQCCGVGACLVSLAKFTNNVDVEDVDTAFCRNSSVSRRLEKYFSVKQLALIETVFEERTLENTWGDPLTLIGGHWKYEFSEKFSIKLKEAIPLFKGSPKKRLIQIMSNIIRNKGTFKPLEG